MILYKYLSEERIVNVIQDKLLRFTPPAYFNDPFEALPNVTGVFLKEFVDTLFFSLLNDSTFKWLTKNVSEENLNSLERLKKNLNEGDKSIKEMYDTLRGTNGKDLSESMQSYWNNQLGILCLSEEFDNLTMWSHYANEHKGFLLGFDSAFPITENEQILNKPRKIKYTNNRPQINLFELEENLKQRRYKWSEAFLYTKSKDWSYENEWRQVNKLDKYNEVIKLNEKEDIHLFKINQEAVKCIVMGCKISPKNEDIIKEHCDKSTINLFKMRTSKTCYLIESIRINNASL